MSSKEKIVGTGEIPQKGLINSNDGELIYPPSKQMLTDWQNYLMSSRQSYLMDRGNSLGNEYFSSKQEWDIIFEREWAIVEERMNVGIGVDSEIISLLGPDFFKNQEQLLDELKATMDLEVYDMGEDNTLTIYTFEDFIMLSNQGIFRDEIFLIDPQRKWKKKVKGILSQYGYDTFEQMLIRGENYLVVSR
tara:strand:- start:2093 stop:2665 length:573 start_codon:yes stop_codon:yes gene_type:complete